MGMVSLARFAKWRPAGRCSTPEIVRALVSPVSGEHDLTVDEEQLLRVRWRKVDR